MSGLTRREREVLVLISLGKTSKEVGESLMLSPRTVEYHLERIYRKLGVTNRMEALGKAYKSGLLRPEQGFLMSEL